MVDTMICGRLTCSMYMPHGWLFDGTNRLNLFLTCYTHLVSSLVEID